MFSDSFMEQLASQLAEKVISQMTDRGSLQQRLMSVEDAAVYIGRTPKAIEHLISRGTIPVTKLDGRRQIDRTVLDKLISDRTYYEV